MNTFQYLQVVRQRVVWRTWSPVGFWAWSQTSAHLFESLFYDSAVTSARFLFKRKKQKQYLMRLSGWHLCNYHMLLLHKHWAKSDNSANTFYFPYCFWLVSCFDIECYLYQLCTSERKESIGKYKEAQVNLMLSPIFYLAVFHSFIISIHMYLILFFPWANSKIYFFKPRCTHRICYHVPDFCDHSVSWELLGVFVFLKEKGNIYSSCQVGKT